MLRKNEQDRPAAPCSNQSPDAIKVSSKNRFFNEMDSLKTQIASNPLKKSFQPASLLRHPRKGKNIFKALGFSVETANVLLEVSSSQRICAFDLTHNYHYKREDPIIISLDRASRHRETHGEKKPKTTNSPKPMSSSDSSDSSFFSSFLASENHINEVVINFTI